MSDVEVAPNGPRQLRLMTYILGGLVSLILFVLMTLTFIDVVGRYFFNKPVQGAYEIIEIGLGIAVFAGLPLVTWDRAHVTVGLFDDLFRGLWLSLQRLFVNLVSAGALGLFTWRLWSQSQQLGQYGDATLYHKIPHAPVAMFMALCCAISLILVLVMTIQDLLAWRRQS